MDYNCITLIKQNTPYTLHIENINENCSLKSYIVSLFSLFEFCCSQIGLTKAHKRQWEKWKTNITVLAHSIAEALENHVHSGKKYN